jgi:predicted Zn-ribbon and HTH transcriptional regulator
MSGLPRDYTKVPWEQRSLAMRVFEKQLGQPMEEVISLLWYKHRKFITIARALGMETTTLRSWMKNLRLRICRSCSADTGRLYMDCEICETCGRYFCKDCIDLDAKYHEPMFKQDFRDLAIEVVER